MIKKYQKFFRNESTFFCFTPIVSLVTFIIEILLASYILFKYKLTSFSRVIVGILVLLGTFQLAEYMMCLGNDPQLWSKVGIASITLLPVMCLHLTTLLTRKSRWTEIGYLLGLGIILAIFFLPVPILPHCTGKFVILGFNNLFGWIFYSFYALFLGISFEMIGRTWIQHKGDKQELFWAMVVYMSFLIPTAVVYFFIITARAGVPSIMCGFAVIGAIIFVFKELPRYYQLQKAKKKKR